MKNKEFFECVLRAAGLVAVIPLLIAHGVGGLDCHINCDPPDPYILSGSQDVDSAINIGSSLFFDFYGVRYQSTTESAGGTVPPILLAPPYLPPERSYPILVNGPLPTSAIADMGELWLHDSSGRSIKLLHPAIGRSFLSIEVDVDRDDGFKGEQSSFVASSSQYMLAGGSSGSEYIELGKVLEIFVNSESIDIESTTSSLGTKYSPIMFRADPGDELRILAKKSDRLNVKTTSLWLFTPSGEGVKLLHSGEEGSVSLANTERIFMDVSYEVP